MIGKEGTTTKRPRTFLLALLIVFGPAVLAIWFLHVTSDLRAQREEAMREAEQGETTGGDALP